jgi:large subunit ribosomal protein L29
MKSRDLMNELKELSTDQLKVRAKQLAEEGMKLRFRKVASQLDTPHRIREVRRNLARARTILRQRELSSVKAA